MKKALIVGIVVIIVAIGGVLFYRSTEPNGEGSDDLIPEEPMRFEEEIDENAVSNGGQFLQMEPDAAPPSGALRDDEVLPEPPAGAGVDVNTNEEDSDSEAVSEVTILITDTGFAPSSVTVEIGTRVTFLNDGQALHWPASNVHPAHELLPGFDASQGLNTGESYSFTFDEVGTWGYHDHLFPNLEGEIVVE